MNPSSAFLYYAVADGIGRLFTRHGKWNRYTPPDTESTALGLVFLGWPDFLGKVHRECGKMRRKFCDKKRCEWRGVSGGDGTAGAEDRSFQ